MTTAMIEGTPKTKAPMIVAAVVTPMRRLRACKAYTRCVTLTSAGAGSVFSDMSTELMLIFSQESKRHPAVFDLSPIPLPVERRTSWCRRFFAVLSAPRDLDASTTRPFPNGWSTPEPNLFGRRPDGAANWPFPPGWLCPTFCLLQEWHNRHC